MEQIIGTLGSDQIQSADGHDLLQALKSSLDEQLNSSDVVDNEGLGLDDDAKGIVKALSNLIGPFTSEYTVGDDVDGADD